MEWDGLVDKVLVPSLLAPFLGVARGGADDRHHVGHPQQGPREDEQLFRRLQLVSGGFVAFTHGTNDAQKTMGIITLARIASGHLSADGVRRPALVVFSAALAMGLGPTPEAGIIATLGSRIAKLDPPQGFAAQTACGVDPVDDGAIRLPRCPRRTRSAVRPRRRSDATALGRAVGVAGNILVAWVLTIPCAASSAPRWRSSRACPPPTPSSSCSPGSSRRRVRRAPRRHPAHHEARDRTPPCVATRWSGARRP